MLSLIKKHCNLLTRQIYARSIIFVKVYGRLAVRFFRGSYKKNRYNEINFPTVMQLPITYKCNFDCVMCGMKTMIKRPGFSPEKLKSILDDPLFYFIKDAGVNGGEPFILNNLEEYITVILETLPQLKNIYIISNGYFTERILSKAAKLVFICREHKVKFHISVSLDGYGHMQDVMRGKEGAFEHTTETCKRIMEDRSRYCDSFGAICTITKVNVYNINELEVWSQQNGIPVSYNIATIHRRIKNEYKYEDFSIYTDEHAYLMATEFFYSQYLKTKEERYYALYYLLHNGTRIASCEHKTNTVTITPDGGISYCATRSDEIGNVLNKSAQNVFFSKDNLAYRKRLHNTYCAKCTHYSGSLMPKDYLKYYAKDRMRETSIYR